MFESITFSMQNKLNPNAPLDIGLLVECMLFYKRVIVVANHTILKQLINYFNADRLIELIEEEILSILYTDTHLGIITNTKNDIQYHDTCQFSSPDHTHQDEIIRVCSDIYKKRGKSRRIANRILDNIQITKHDNIILEGTRESILDQKYVESAARVILNELVPEFSDISKINFNTFNTSDGIVVETNINYSEINKFYHKHVSPKHSSISTAHILVHLLDAERDLYFSSSRLSELASSNLSSKIIGQKINYMLSRGKKSRDTIDHFNNFIFKDGKSLREAVNLKQIDLNELISILKKSTRFKNWIVDINPDEELVNKYYQEVTKKTIIDKLPGKTARWAIFMSLGVVTDIVAAGGFAAIGGAALGALDTFFLDKLISGWKPNQFIEEDVKKLLK